MEEILVCGALGFTAPYLLYSALLLWNDGLRKLAVLLALMSPALVATGFWLAHNYYV